MSWTFRFFAEFLPVLTLSSAERYRKALLQEQRHLVSLDDQLQLTVKYPGRWTFTLRPASNDSYTFREIFIERVYEVLTHHIAQARTVIDLGANIGMASIYFRGCWPDAKLVCVEPAIDNIELLKKNMHHPIADGTCLVMYGAVWGHSGSVAITPLEKGHVNQRSCYEEKDVGMGQLVPAYTVRHIINQSGFTFVDVLKIDIEGAEVELFRGEVDWLRMVGLLAIEFHGNSRRESGFDAVVKKYGFVIVDEQEHTVLAKHFPGV